MNPIPSSQEVTSGNIGLKPSCWGPPAWHFLHSIAMGYPETISNQSSDQQIAQNYRQFFESLGNTLPCSWCRTNYMNNLESLPIDGFLSGRRKLSRWVWSLHNLVNRETGVPESKWPSFEEIYKKYESYGATCNGGILNTCGGGDEGCHMVVKNENIGTSVDNVFKTWWPLIVAIVVLLVVISIVFIRKEVIKK